MDRNLGRVNWQWISALDVSTSMATLGPNALLFGTHGVGSNPIPPSPCSDCIVRLDISGRHPRVKQLYRGTTDPSGGKDIFITDPVWGVDGHVYGHDGGQLYGWNATDGELVWAVPNAHPNSYTHISYAGNPVLNAGGTVLYIAFNDQSPYGHGHVVAMSLESN